MGNIRYIEIPILRAKSYENRAISNIENWVSTGNTLYKNKYAAYCVLNLLKCNHFNPRFQAYTGIRCSKIQTLPRVCYRKYLIVFLTWIVIKAVALSDSKMDVFYVWLLDTKGSPNSIFWINKPNEPKLISLVNRFLCV